MKFWHTGILTDDLEKTLKTLCAIPGVKREKFMEFEMEMLQSEMLVGTGGKLRIAAGRIGGIVHEVIQPLDDLSYQAKTLKARGPGFQHAAYVCEDNLDEVIASFIAAGGRIVWEAKHEGEHVVYVESGDGGTVWEFIDVCPMMPEE